MLQVPEDLALILNDSALFSKDADLTIKEILKRYAERAKAPTVNSAHPQSANSASNGTTSPTPVATRVDTDPHMQNAWQNESSVRHVGSDNVGSDNNMHTPPTLPYAKPRGSSESQGSPNRSSVRSGLYDKQRAVGVA